MVRVHFSHLSLVPRSGQPGHGPPRGHGSASRRTLRYLARHGVHHRSPVSAPLSPVRIWVAQRALDRPHRTQSCPVGSVRAFAAVYPVRHPSGTAASPAHAAGAATRTPRPTAAPARSALRAVRPVLEPLQRCRRSAVRVARSAAPARHWSRPVLHAVAAPVRTAPDRAARCGMSGSTRPEVTHKPPRSSRTTRRVMRTTRLSRAPGTRTRSGWCLAGWPRPSRRGRCARPGRGPRTPRSPGPR